jgi:hypothetical protein
MLVLFENVSLVRKCQFCSIVSILFKCVSFVRMRQFCLNFPSCFQPCMYWSSKPCFHIFLCRQSFCSNISISFESQIGPKIKFENPIQTQHYVNELFSKMFIKISVCKLGTYIGEKPVRTNLVRTKWGDQVPGSSTLLITCFQKGWKTRKSWPNRQTHGRKEKDRGESALEGKKARVPIASTGLDSVTRCVSKNGQNVPKTLKL